MSTPIDRPVFRLAYVPGATPAKWVRIWQERLPEVPLELLTLGVTECSGALAERRVDMAITRLPEALTDDTLGPHHTIELYTESTVAVVPEGHLLTAAKEITLADLHGETVLRPLDEALSVPQLLDQAAEHRPATTADAIEVVAAGVGLLVVPQSLARLHHRKDLRYRPITDAATSTVGLLWPAPTSDLADEFIGIVRGRKATSSRGTSEPTVKRSAKEKAAAKRARREAAGRQPTKRRRK